MTAIYECVFGTRLSCSFYLLANFLYAKVRWNSHRGHRRVIFRRHRLAKQPSLSPLRRYRTHGFHRLLWGPHSPDHRDLGFRVAENDPASAAHAPRHGPDFSRSLDAHYPLLCCQGWSGFQRLQLPMCVVRNASL